MRLWRGIINLFRRERVEAEIEAELRSHLEMAAEDAVRSGMSEEEARRVARVRFGNLQVMRERTVGADAALWVEGLWRDVRFALRQMKKSPGFTVTAVLTLALAIGANTSVFSLVHAILLSRLPFKDPGRVLSIQYWGDMGLGYISGTKDAEATFRHAARSFTTLDSAAIYVSTGTNVVLRKNAAERLQAAEVSAQFLRVLGVTPILGRGFAPDEDVPGKDHAVLISDRLWRERFGSERGVIGRKIRVNGFVFEIIGVLPPHLNFPGRTELWTPTIFDPHTSLIEAGAFIPHLIARVRAGVPIGAVRAEAKSRWQQVRKVRASAERPILTPIASELTKSIRSSLWLLCGAVGFVLLIACANIACLMLVRTSERRAELAVRAALGAARGRLLQQQLVESILIAMLSGGLGSGLAEGILRLLYVFRPQALAAYPRPHLNLEVLAFTAGVALIAGVTSGIVPAVLAGQRDPVEALKHGVWRRSGYSSRFRQGLVMAEIAMTFVLLIGTGLLIHSLVNLGRVPLGYRVRNVLTFSVSRSSARSTGGKKSLHRDSQIYAEVLDRLAAIPGVESVGAADDVPLSRQAQMLMPVSAEHPEHAGGKSMAAIPRVASGGYFRAMGISLVEGRTFSRSDSRGSQKVVIVSQDLARRLWPGENPIGHRLHCRWFCHSSAVVIGVVRTNRSFGPRSNALPEYFLPFTQQGWPFMTFAVRVHGDPASYVHSIRQAVAAVDPADPIYDVRTMKQRLDASESLIRFEAFALTGFACLALMLAVIGLYGILSYRVTQRVREIGLRIALGASRQAIHFSFVREAIALTVTGVLIGLGVSLALDHFLSTVLFRIKPDDPWTMGAVGSLFFVITLAAAYLPARRAAGVDPMRVLRME